MRRTHLHYGHQQLIARHGLSRLLDGTHWRLLCLLVVSLLMDLGVVYAAPSAYITNSTQSGSGIVSVIDTVRNTVVATVPVGIGAQGVTVHPAGTFVYVANQLSNTISIIDTATNTVVNSVGVGNGPFGIAVHPMGTRIYVTNRPDGTVSVLDPTVPTVIATISLPTGSRPGGIAVHPSGTQVYVANGTSSGTVSVLDTATNTVTATVPVGKDALGIAVHPSGRWVYVSNLLDGTLSIIDTTTNTVTGTVSVGTGPQGVTVHPAGTFVYVANQNGTVSVINTTTNTVTATVRVGDHPWGIAVHPAGTFVYVANFLSNTVSVMDTASLVVVATVPVGEHPIAFGQFIGPSLGPAPPTLSLALTGCTRCRAGDRLTVQAHVTNTAPTATPVEAKIGVRLPNGTSANLLGEFLKVILAAHSDTIVTIFDITVPPGLPTGNWVFEGALLEPALGVTLCRNAQLFEVVP